MSVYFSQNYTTNNFNTKDSWIILNPIEKSIKEKIERIGTPLKNWDIKINYGIKTGFNEAFIIDGITKDRLISEDPKSAEIIRPILRGRDIKRYSYDFADLWIINTHNGFINSNKQLIPKVDIEQYPAVKNHLDIFIKELNKRQDKGDTPYNLRSCAYMEDFNKQKIVYSEIVNSPRFYLDTKGIFFAEATVFIMTGENLEILCKVLNSKFLSSIFKLYYSGGGLGESGFRYKKIFLENLPIPKLDFFISNLKKEISEDSIEQELIKVFELNNIEIKLIYELS